MSTYAKGEGKHNCASLLIEFEALVRSEERALVGASTKPLRWRDTERLSVLRQEIKSLLSAACARDYREDEDDE